MENDTGKHAIVGAIMADALAEAGRPGEILARVSALVAPKSGADLGGRKRKLTSAQAARAATSVSTMMARLGVSPAQACRAAGVASSANNFHAFHLTDREMGQGGAVTFPEDRFSRSLHHYHRLALEAARLAAQAGTITDPAALVDELAGSVADFLAPFVPVVERTAFEKVAGHLNLLGEFFGKPRRGPAGTMVDLQSFWEACERSSLAYCASKEAVGYAGMEPGENWTGNLPAILLLPRVVGRVSVTCFVPREVGADTDDAAPWSDAGREMIGRVEADLLYGVSLALAPGRGGRVTVRFLLEPWTAIVQGPRSKVHAEEGGVLIWIDPAEIMVRGFPFGGLAVEDDEGRFMIEDEGAVEARCPDFARWIADDDGDPGTLGSPRTLPVTPETCEMLLGPVPRTQLWDFDWPFKGNAVLDGWVEQHGGVPSCETLDRVSDRLYRDDEGALDGLLLKRAEILSVALARHFEGAADGAARKEAAFLRRMRS